MTITQIGTAINVVAMVMTALSLILGYATMTREPFGFWFKAAWLSLATLFCSQLLTGTGFMAALGIKGLLQ